MVVKNPAVAVFFLFMGLVLAYSVLISLPSPAPAAPEPFDRGAGACVSGTTKYCAVGSCSGVSTCVGGVWGGCRWETRCTPGSRASCLDGGCSYAVKECNECGTGYGACFNP